MRTGRFLHLPQLTFLLDENVSHKTLTRFRRIGLNVESVKKQNRLGITNGDLMKLTNEKTWILITHDSDFLNFKFKPEHGVIVVKIHPAIDDVSGILLEKFLSSTNHENFRRKIIILEKKGWHYLDEQKTK